MEFSCSIHIYIIKNGTLNLIIWVFKYNKYLCLKSKSRLYMSIYLCKFTLIADDLNTFSDFIFYINVLNIIYRISF